MRHHQKVFLRNLLQIQKSESNVMVVSNYFTSRNNRKKLCPGRLDQEDKLADNIKLKSNSGLRSFSFYEYINLRLRF
jgi:hypothetical protein